MTLAVVFAIVALAGFVLGTRLVLFGVFPPEGEGSLGHVGAVVAGGVFGFAGIAFVLLAWWAALRARAVNAAQQHFREE